MKKYLFLLTKILLGLLVVFFLFLTIVIFLPTRYYPEAEKSYNNVLIKNCHIVDIENNKIQFNRQVTIKNGLIVAVDSMNQFSVADTIEVIDANGAYLMPSLWDMHLHTISLSPQIHFPLLIASGVTHVRDMGDGDSWQSDLNDSSIRDKTVWEDRQRKQGLLMPQIMEATSFHIEEYNGSDQNSVSATAKDLVAKLRQRNEPFLKVQLKEGDYPTPFFYALQRQARFNKMAILGHLPADVNLDSVFTYGFKSVEHAWALIPHFVKNKNLSGSDIERKKHDLQFYDPLLAKRYLSMMAAQCVYYVPTHVTSNRKEYLAFEEGFNDHINNQYVESTQLLFWKLLNRLHSVGYDAKTDLPILKQYYQHGLSLTKAAHANGVKILAGSDALDRNVFYGISLHEELEEMVKAGLSNAEALKTATMNPAEYYGLSKIYGSIEPGKKACLLLVQQNPLENIRHTKLIKMVFFHSKIYRETDLANMKKFVKAEAKSYSVSCKFIWNLIKN